MIGSRMRLPMVAMACVACSAAVAQPLALGPFTPSPVTTLYLVADGTPNGIEFVDKVVSGQWLSERLTDVEVALIAGMFADRVAGAHATVIRRLLDAGAVPLGKANMHEFAFGFTGLKTVDDAYTLVLDATAPTLAIVSPGDGDRIVLGEPADVIIQSFDRYGIERVEVQQKR